VAALKIFYQIGSWSAKQKFLTEIANLSASHKQLPTLDSSEWQKASCLVSGARKSQKSPRVSCRASDAGFQNDARPSDEQEF
jgi:hypothetical protein